MSESIRETDRRWCRKERKKIFPKNWKFFENCQNGGCCSAQQFPLSGRPLSDDSCNLRWPPVTSGDLRWPLVTSGDLWWLPVNCIFLFCGLWWLLLTSGDLRWPLVTSGDLWWLPVNCNFLPVTSGDFLLTSGDLWWLLLNCKSSYLWPLVTYA